MYRTTMDMVRRMGLTESRTGLCKIPSSNRGNGGKVTRRIANPFHVGSSPSFLSKFAQALEHLRGRLAVQAPTGVGS